MDSMPPPAPRSGDASKPRRVGASPLSSTSGPHRGSGLQWGVPPSIAEDGNAPAGEGGRHPAPSRAVGNNPPHVTEISSWEQYFDEMNQIEVPSRGCNFNVYKAGNEGPIIFCLHGGGYNGCSWALVAAAMKDQCVPMLPMPLGINPGTPCRVVAPDMRGHGLTQSADDLDLSKETLAEDAAALWEELFGGEGQGRRDTVLLGHSLGGGIAVWAAALRRISALAGVVVIDVVEGTALASLVHMKTVLGNRPASFPSLEAAVEWALDSGISRSRKAASVSIPGQLLQDSSGGEWRWRTPLEETRPFWEGWYRGLSEAFLALTMPKVLLLAGSDRLDRALTIGQMQGKFQLVVVPSAGHAVQEDESGRVVDVLRAFIKRFRISEPPSSGLSKPVPGLAPVLPVAAGPIHDGK